MIVPTAYEATPWRRPPPNAGQGYLTPGQPSGGGATLRWLSSGAGRGRSGGSGKTAYVEHVIELTVDTVAWPPRQEPRFLAALCGQPSLKAPAVEGRAFGRMTFAYDCGERESARERHATRRGWVDRGEKGRTVESHFVVVLGSASWRPFTPEYNRKALRVLHVSQRSAWSNVFDHGVLAARGKASADYRKLTATLAPRKGEETTTLPSALAPPVPEPAPPPAGADPGTEPSVGDSAVPLFR